MSTPLQTGPQAMTDTGTTPNERKTGIVQTATEGVQILLPTAAGSPPTGLTPNRIIDDRKVENDGGDVTGAQGVGSWQENQQKQGNEGGDFDYGS